MPLQNSGAISLSQIASEFNDSQPHSLNEFYAGGSAGVTSGGAPNVPSSGEISLDDFYGAANQVTVTLSNSTNQNAASLFGSSYSSSIPKVLIIPSGVEVGATSLSNYALTVPSGMGGTLNIQNAGTISGAGGDGSSSGNGGDGGEVKIIGGEGRGTSSGDTGGNIEMSGGIAYGGTGGDINIITGTGTLTSSGSIDIKSANSGQFGLQIWIRRRLT